jgi:malate dehydrogenase (oxaloacetate-decarboxylating)
MTVRVEIPHRPGQFARLATAIAEENANLGAVDIVEVKRDKMIRDVTFDAESEDHALRVVERLRTLPDVRGLSASDRTFLMHLGGKIHTRSKVPLRTRNALSMAYTPGVARVSRAIAEDKRKAYAFTSKANSVAVVTDGSAVLGLGNLGPEAALPVMEGKVMLLKEFADIDGWPLCLATQDTEAIVRFIEAVAPTFGGINLEDISAPRCFDIEEQLRESLDIPVIHDDQHGTAVVLLAALQNALKVVGKDLRRIKVVVNGLGAAGTASPDASNVAERILKHLAAMHQTLGIPSLGLKCVVGAKSPVPNSVANASEPSLAPQTKNAVGSRRKRDG